MRVDQLPQLADVARIVARATGSRAPPASSMRRRVVGLSCPQEVRRQRQDVLAPLAQRRQAADPAGDAVVEVARGTARRRRPPQVAVRRADEAELACAARCCRPTRLYVLLLHHAQQLRLQRQRQLADLVEEQRAAVGQRERAVARRHRAR